MKCKDCAEWGSEFCKHCDSLDEQTIEDTTTSSVAFPPTMMPKRLLRRRKEPKVQEIVMVDKRYNEAKRGTPVLRKRFRKYIEDPS
jgi:hypothetical protein